MAHRVLCFFAGVLAFAGCSSTVTRKADFAALREGKDPAACPAEVKDVDENVYPTVQIGAQCWQAENLRVLRYRDGSAIENTSVIDVARYGVLYRFPHAVDVRGLCPIGWHVPSDDEVQTLERAIGLDESALTERGWRGDQHARALKEDVTATSWAPDEEKSVNTSGFSLRAAGEHIGFFRGADGLYAGLWTTTTDGDLAFVRYFMWMALNPRNDRIWRDSVDKERAYSVRCLMDAPSSDATP